MTRRGGAVLAIGLAAWIVAWLFGSRALFPVSAGLVLAVPVAVAWVRLSRQRLAVSRRWVGHAVVEGGDVGVDLRVDPGSRIPLPSAVAHETIGRLGEQIVELRRKGGVYVGSYTLRNVARGRHVFEPLRVAVSDPWQLAETSLHVDAREVLVVHPRLVELDELFSEVGATLADGRRLLLRRPTGLEFHTVRHHVPGESLRRVHWPSTARTGTLMVKEFEDSPRDEVAVLLDGDPAGVAGAAPDSSFDAAVRAAGSILRAHVRGGRSAVLVLNTREREVQSVTADGPEWERALGVLAGAVPDARTPAAALLDSGDGPAARSLELVVVTSRLEPGLVRPLLARALSHRPVAVVHVDAPTFAGRPSTPHAELLQLRAVGVPIAVVRHGDDLREALRGISAAARAGAALA
ncbi:MAG TPA: DUF58 domain-containing protein [Gaiellaceae bacterium]|nr:DUF58 domain-containing protein [Gaiellaceae bacterium]